MTPMMISVMVFVAVAGLVGAAGLRVPRHRAADRPTGSTCWSASGGKDDRRPTSCSSRRFEGDKKIAAGDADAEIPQPAEDVRAGRLPHQAEHAVRHRAACWRVVGATGQLLLAGATIYVAPVGGLLMFIAAVAVAVLNKRRVPAEEVRRAAARRAWNWWPGPCGPGTRLAAGMHVVAEEMPDADRRGVRPGLRGAEPGHPPRGRAEDHVRPRAQPGPALLRDLAWPSSGRPAATWPRSSTRSATSSASASAFWAR